MPRISDGTVVETLRDAKTRFLEDRERPFSTADVGTPLVVEPAGDRSIAALSRIMSAQGAEIRRALHAHGAVLFRGFALRTEEEMDRAVRSLPGASPMTGYFMSELGRDQAGGLKSVFNTNSYKRTGGSVGLSGFHSENFYSADVPQLQVFWCKTRPWLGGETGFVHMTRAYAELDPLLQQKLEREPVGSVQWTLAQVAEAYGLSEARAERFFRDIGLFDTRFDGVKVVNLHKPPVYRHPVLGTKALMINLAGELRGTTPILEKLLAPAYAGPEWALHRLAWKHPLVAQAWGRVERLPTTLRHPDVVGKEELAALKGIARSLRARALRKRNGGAKAAPAAPRPERSAGGMMGAPRRPVDQGPAPYGMTPIARRIGPADVEAIARAVHKHTTVFTWRTGDLVLFDNLQLMHGGMPGLGPREIRVMMCNPVPLQYPFATGLCEVKADPSFRSLDERLRALASAPEVLEVEPAPIAEPMERAA
ncbi:MAG: TauD/TfdA family dioxygenase [Byssovorax sp.]